MSRDQIDKSFNRQLLVEGFDDRTFFDQLAKHLNYRGKFGIVECVGWTQIKDDLLNVLSDTEYYRKLKHIGIVRDADQNRGTFSSVQSALKYANREVSKRRNETDELQPAVAYSIPTQPLVMADSESSPSVSVLILPNVNERGALENYVKKALKGNELWSCVDDYFNCLTNAGLSIEEDRRAKSEIGVFISGLVVDPNEAKPADSRRKLLSDIYRLAWWKNNNMWEDDIFSDATKFLKQLVEDYLSTYRPNPTANSSPTRPTPSSCGNLRATSHVPRGACQ